MNTECGREQDVLDAVMCGQWPDRADAALRQHVHQCTICADLVQVAAVIHDDRVGAQTAARIPSSGLVWWRAQQRARREASRAAARPITFAQGLAAASGMGIAAAVLGLASPWMREWTAWLAGVVSETTLPTPGISTVVATLQGSTVWLIALAGWLVVTPLVIYLTVAADDES